MKDNKSYIRGALSGALAMFVIGCAVFAGLYLTGSGFLLQKQSAVVDDAEEKKLEEIQAYIDMYYLYTDDVEDEQMANGLYKGYVDALGDQYSQYYDEEETAALNSSIEGTYVGIGVLMSQNKESGIITVSDVYDGPAKEAGVQKNDILYKVENEEVTGIDLTTVVTKVKGEEGSKVNLTFYRNSEEIAMSIPRKKVETQTVSYEVKENGIGYLRISEFDQVTLDQFLSAKDELMKAGIKGLVIDLRSNPGGNLYVVTEILKSILPKGLIVYTEDKLGQKSEISGEGESPLDIPLSVLVNGQSASASEIFAGAVQDYEIGTIVGTTTFGKGIVQQVFKLTDGTQLKLTISQYFTPKGRNIHGKGIDPDEVIEYEYDAANPTVDNQLQKALELVGQKITANE